MTGFDNVQQSAPADAAPGGTTGRYLLRRRRRAEQTYLHRPIFFVRKEDCAIKPDSRTNEQIRVPEIILVDENGEKIGVVPTRDALQRAKELDLDLVEVAPNAKPPVCRIYDFRKVIYEQKQKLKASRKKTKSSELKEIVMRVTIDAHDRDTKLRKARGFLEKGDKVKFTFRYRGREITKPQLGQNLVREVLEGLKDIGEVEKAPSQQHKTLSMIVSRRKDWKPGGASATPEKEGEKTAGNAPS